MSFFVRHKKSPPLKPQPNPYPSRFQKWRQGLGFTFIFILILGGSIWFYKPLYQRLQQELFEGTTQLQGAFNYPLDEAQSLLHRIYVFMNLSQEHAHLSQENEKLRWQAQALESLYYENKILRQHLHIPLVEKHGHLTAKILVSPYDGLHHFFLIAAGEKEGLQKDQAVIVKEGVVGRLEKIGRHVSRVLLLNDANSRIPVITTTSQQKAILAGDGTFFPTLVYVGDIHKLQKGEKVITSGMGGIFPSGLPIGIIDDITNGKVKIRPYVPFRDIDWVHVLQNHSEDFTEELNAALRAE